MDVGDVLKWALVAIVALVVWRWIRARGAVQSNYYAGGYPVGIPGNNGGVSAAGFVPFNGGLGGGFTFGLNVPGN